MNNQVRLDDIERRLNEALHPSVLHVIDESHHHIGHAGAQSGLGHFAIEIHSSDLEGKSLISAHRMIYAALGGMMETDIHALRIVLLSGT